VRCLLHLKKGHRQTKHCLSLTQKKVPFEDTTKSIKYTALIYN
jgi:hypothetical protein